LNQAQPLPKQPSLKGLAMQAGSKARANRRRQKPTFELPWVYCLLVLKQYEEIDEA
jgi:hypothetical protein